MAPGFSKKVCWSRLEWISVPVCCFRADVCYERFAEKVERGFLGKLVALAAILSLDLERGS